jgi:hypothetical protein
LRGSDCADMRHEGGSREGLLYVRGRHEKEGKRAQRALDEGPPPLLVSDFFPCSLYGGDKIFSHKTWGPAIVEMGPMKWGPQRYHPSTASSATTPSLQKNTQLRRPYLSPGGLPAFRRVHLGGASGGSSLGAHLDLMKTLGPDTTTFIKKHSPPLCVDRLPCSLYG